MHLRMTKKKFSICFTTLSLDEFLKSPKQGSTQYEASLACGTSLEPPICFTPTSTWTINLFLFLTLSK